MEFEQNPLQLSREKLGTRFRKHVEHPADHTAVMPKWQAVMAVTDYKMHACLPVGMMFGLLLLSHGPWGRSAAVAVKGSMHGRMLC